jgi:homoserine kinase type II
VHGIPLGSVNTNCRVETAEGRFFLRVYEEQGLEGARGEVALARALAAAGVPAARPVEPAARDASTPGDAVFTLAGKPAALFSWCEGGMRCQASVTEDDTRAVGAALARVHALSGAASPGVVLRPSRFGEAQLRERIARIATAKEASLSAQARPLTAALDTWVAARDPSLPRGLIHSDLFRDNVLFGEGATVSALLDFESASEGVFAYDLMVTVLAWCYGDHFDAHLAQALVRGYTATRPLTPAEIEGLHAEACFAALRFTVTRITDYAMRPAGGHVAKDYRRFARRREELEALGRRGWRKLLGL